eukprot:CAMPEP_0115026858 /NCGR_PEP_ID=MMETSP0216-20121206/35052_1 /TAXON_ID=223996 /ORGANISM="Protocruzia adherens, Strain Boccale" /LENGTH=338 /DNA_ID=CAMNT_0002402125 /DNA_START=614 /DNA_END=1630 /DNA_ORIENTATION=-
MATNCAIRDCEFNKSCKGCPSSTTRHSRSDKTCANSCKKWHEITASLKGFFALNDRKERNDKICDKHHTEWEEFQLFLKNLSSSNDDVKIDALKSLSRICRWLPNKRKQFCSSKGVTQLISLLNSNSGNIQVLEHLTGLLRILSKDGCKNELIENGAVGAVHKVMKIQLPLVALRQANYLIIENLCASLWNLATSELKHDETKFEETIESLFGYLMNTEMTDNNIKYQLIGSLWCLSLNPTLKARIHGEVCKNISCFTALFELPDLKVKEVTIGFLNQLFLFSDNLQVEQEGKQSFEEHLNNMITQLKRHQDLVTWRTEPVLAKLLKTLVGLNVVAAA